MENEQTLDQLGDVDLAIEVTSDAILQNLRNYISLKNENKPLNGVFNSLRQLTIVLNGLKRMNGTQTPVYQACVVGKIYADLTAFNSGALKENVHYDSLVA